MKPPIAHDPYYGSYEKNSYDSHLARVDSVDEDTGLISVNYITTPGSESNLLYLQPAAFTSGYGIFALPAVGSVVEVRSLQDKTRVCRPAFIQYKNVRGGLDPANLQQEVDEQALHPLLPGEILIRGDDGGQVFLTNLGGVVIADSGGSTIDVDSDNGGIIAKAVRTHKAQGAETIVRTGAVRRDQVNTEGGYIAEDEVDSVEGFSAYQEFNVGLYSSQVEGIRLQGISLKFGDVFSDAIIPLRDSLLMGKFQQTDLTGLVTTEWELKRTGGYDLKLGLLNQINNSYDAVTGSVTEKASGPRDVRALSLEMTSRPTYDAAELAKLELTAAGAINLTGPNASGKWNVDGSISIEGLNASLDLGATGSVDLKSPAAELTMTVPGAVALKAPAAELTMSVPGAVDLKSPLAELTMSEAGIVALKSTPQLTMEGIAIQLGKIAVNHVAMAEPIAIILAALNVLNKAVQTHTHVLAVAGVVPGPGSASGTAMPSPELQSQIVPPAPGAAGVGSTTVTVQT